MVGDIFFRANTKNLALLERFNAEGIQFACYCPPATLPESGRTRRADVLDIQD